MDGGGIPGEGGVSSCRGRWGVAAAVAAARGDPPRGLSPLSCSSMSGCSRLMVMASKYRQLFAGEVLAEAPARRV